MENKEILLWVLLFIFAGWSFFRSRETKPPDVSRLERKIDHLLKYFEIDPQEAAAVSLSVEVISLIGAGKKIAAIKQLRKETYMGLREAKEAIEEFQAQDRAG